MADLTTIFGGEFDSSTVAPNAPRGLIPAGNYIVEMIRSELFPTNDGNGQRLECEYVVLDGEQKGAHLWDNLNLVNPSAKAQEIAHGTLSSICHAVGGGKVAKSEQLHFKPLVAVVKVEPAGPDKNGVHREAKSVIGGYRPVAGATPSAGGVPRQPSTPAQRPATATATPTSTTGTGARVMPWQRS